MAKEILRLANSHKPVLAVETSGNLCSIALILNKGEIYEAGIKAKNIHSEKIFSMIEFVLKSAATELKDIGAIAVSAGPGSFTGLRIGFSAVKGIAFGAGIPVAAVPTFEAMALNISTYYNSETKFAIANKVNISEFYYACFSGFAGSYSIKENIHVIDKKTLEEKTMNMAVFGNAFNSKELHSFPSATAIGIWYLSYGRELLRTDYDYLEPDYFKDFVIKEKK